MRKIVSGEMITVMIIMGLGVLSMSMLNPILPLYLTSIDISPEILGLMLSVAMAGMVIGESSWGWVADRVGFKIPFGAGTFLSAIAVLFFVFTQDIPAIFTIFFLWGIVRSALFGPGRGYIAASAPLMKKATFMAIVSAMMAASRSLGALPSGFIVDTWGYHTVFFVSSGIAVLGGFAVVIGLRKTNQENPSLPNVTASSSDEISPSNQGFNYKYFILQCVITALQFSVIGLSTAFLPLLATEVIGVTATEVGILFTIMGMTTMILGIPMGMLADRTSKKLFMILGLLMSALSMAGTAFAPNYIWLIVSTIGNSLGLAMFSPAALGLISDTVPINKQSTAMGFYGAFGENIGIIAGAAIGGFIWSAWGSQVTFLFGTIATCLGVVLCLSLLKEKSHR